MDSVPTHVPRSPNAGALLHLHVRPGPQVVVISISGELDRSTAPVLDACLNRLLDSDATPATLTIDLARTTFMDVGALNVLLAAARRAGTSSRAVRLVGCNPLALRLIRIAGVTDVFDEIAHRGRRAQAGSGVPQDCPDRLAAG